MNGYKAIPIVWPPVPEPIPVPVEVKRWCVDWSEPLPEPTGGRLRIRCEACRNPEPVPDLERPFRTPNGEDNLES